MNNFNAALQLAERGFKVFPLAPGAKAPPLITGWPEKATIDGQAIDHWWLVSPGANIGIHCDGLCVVDVDPKKGGDDALRQLDDLLGFPPTLTTRTPSGGRHCFYRLPDGHPGVPNSVGELGPGLDIRSRGGYVVAPGSVVPAGVYAFDDAGATIAPAPVWLLRRLGNSAPIRDAARNELEAVTDAPDEIVERARHWLQTAERSVRGNGGDQAAYRVACKLRDLGVSYQQACELMRSDAWDGGCGWREGKLEDKPIRSAYRYATGEAGSKAALPSEFPVVEALPNSGMSAPKSGRARRLSEFAKSEVKNAGYVVKGMLQRASYAEVYGAPGAGKTFITLDIAYHVAADKPWMEHKVRGGPVLYLAFEGAGGMVKRAQALRQKYGDADVPLYIVDAAFDLREQGGRQALGGVIAELPEKPVLIIIDTLARALMGGDENSAQDVGAFNAAVAALIKSTGACVLIVHHSGKDKSKGARGSSAILGALDTEIEVDNYTVKATKQRDVELGEPIGFKLAPVMVGVDEDGDELTSCVVEPGSAAPQGRERITGNAKRGFEVLCTKWEDNRPIDPLEWRDACREFLNGPGLSQRFYDLKKKLLAAGHIEVDGRGFITRRLE